MRDKMPLLMSIVMLLVIGLLLGLGIDSAREQGMRLSGAGTYVSRLPEIG